MNHICSIQNYICAICINKKACKDFWFYISRNYPRVFTFLLEMFLNGPYHPTSEQYTSKACNTS